MGQALNSPSKGSTDWYDCVHMKKMTHRDTPLLWMMTTKWRASPLTRDLCVALGPGWVCLCKGRQKYSVTQRRKDAGPPVLIRGMSGGYAGTARVPDQVTSPSWWQLKGLLQGMSDVQFQVSTWQSALPSFPVKPLSAPCPKSSVKSSPKRQECVSIKSI